MQLRELNGQLTAYKTTCDVINEDSVNQFHEFLISEQVANELRKCPSYLATDYWYLVISKDLSIGNEEFYWEITVRDVPLQLSNRGVVKFEDELIILSFS